MQTMGLAMEEMRHALDGKEYVEQYVQSLTHQLKSPLTAIRGAVELLDENPPAPDRERFQRNLRIEADRLQRIVDRQLFLSSIESRRELGETTAIEMGPLLHEVIESLETIMQARRVKSRCLGDETLTVRGERFLVWHAVQNILQNAIEFSPSEGRIEISLHAMGAAVEMRCTDQGPGIPEYAIARIFDRFYSLPRPDTGKKSSGLGLAFVREVAALHGGNVKIANLPGQGAIVILQLRR
jgi:two-component system sensor histidine kinase CreC